MEWFATVGYMAAALMFSTFYMKRMIPLRAVGIASNVTFIIFASFSHVWPLLILHCALLPLNTIRMLQMIKLVKKVKEASKGDFSMDFLVPFMQHESFKKGDVLFKKGDDSNKMFYLQKGTARVEESGVVLKEGEVIGEIGIFSPEKTRTATIVCDSDVDFYTIPDNKILEIYYQNPEFGLYLVQLIIKRLTAK